ncbi:hypothetical protein DV736_g2646, partial [Chaetothyriales sp. CBS 134916]
MAPSLKSLYRGNSAAQQGQQQPQISFAGADHQSQGHNETYGCSYESKDCSSFRPPAPIKTSVDLFDEESPPSSPKERSSITITIPFPWPKKFSRRSSSVPAGSRGRRRADQAINPDAYITSPIPTSIHSPEVHHITSPIPSSVHSPEVHHITSPIAPSVHSPEIHHITNPIPPSSHSPELYQVFGAVSPHIGSLKQTSVPSTRALPLSPVNEGFASPDSAHTTDNPSPVTPIDPDAQEDFHTTIITTTASNGSIADSRPTQSKEILRQETARQIEFGVPLASNPVFPARDDRPFSRASPFDPSTQHRKEPAPGLAATAFMRSTMAAPPGYQWELRARSPSIPVTMRNGPVPTSPGHHRVSSDTSSHRRHSASTSQRSQTTDDESTTSSDDRYSRSSRASWQQLQRSLQQAEAGNGGSGPGSAVSYATGPAFYRAVTDDYKKIFRDSGDHNAVTGTGTGTNAIARRGSAPETIAPAKTPVGLNLTRYPHHHYQQQKQQKTTEIVTMGEPGPEVRIVDDPEDHLAPLQTLVPSGQELWG